MGVPLFPVCEPSPPPPQVLEYVGKGKSIVDVGLAQARRPLSPRSHYFELEILDPGEKCYIALGVARKVCGGARNWGEGECGGWRHLQNWGGREVGGCGSKMGIWVLQRE